MTRNGFINQSEDFDARGEFSRLGLHKRNDEYLLRIQQAIADTPRLDGQFLHELAVAESDRVIGMVERATRKIKVTKAMVLAWKKQKNAEVALRKRGEEIEASLLNAIFGTSDLPAKPKTKRK